MTVLALALLAQVAVGPDGAPGAEVLGPGSSYYWQRPCEVAFPDPKNLVEYFATNYLVLIGEKRTVKRCIQPAGSPTPVVLSMIAPDDSFFILYSAEVAEFSRLAIKGIVAHEVAHISLGVGCQPLIHRPLTHEEYVTCESAVDHEAARLAGVGAMKAAFTEVHKLHVRLTGASMLRARHELMEERMKMLDEPAKELPKEQ